MCGRYAASARPDELIEQFEVALSEMPSDLPADHNVAPTKPAPVVVNRTLRDGGPDPVRQLRLLTWGLVPSWSKSRTGAARMINARAESLFSKPAYRRAAAARRALVPAAGWYEWAAGAAGAKQPYFISRVDGATVAFAGLYEFWRDPGLPDDHPQAWLTSFAVITTTAEPGPVAAIHDRMPVVLEPEVWADWLDPELSDPGLLTGLLAGGLPGRFTAHPVGSAVGNPANNGPELVRPVVVHSAQGQVALPGM